MHVYTLEYKHHTCKVPATRAAEGQPDMCASLSAGLLKGTTPAQFEQLRQHSGPHLPCQAAWQANKPPASVRYALAACASCMPLLLRDGMNPRPGELCEARYIVTHNSLAKHLTLRPSRPL